MTTTDTVNLVDIVREAIPFFTQEDAQIAAGYAYRALEMRTGEILTKGMSDEMLDEFGLFTDKDKDGIEAWYATNHPNYASDKDYQHLAEANPDVDQLDLMAEYGAMVWLRYNRPDYPDVVKQSTDTVVTALQDAILELGEEAVRAWLGLHRTAWAWAFNNADDSDSLMTNIAAILLHENQEDLRQWAQAQAVMASLAERARILDDNE